MFGVPLTIVCPKCRKMVNTFFDKYNIDNGEPNPDIGLWRLALYCTKCGHEWKYAFELRIIFDEFYKGEKK